MEPTEFFGEAILSVLAKLRYSEALVDYSSIDGEEFLQLPERGFYLQAKNGSGIVSQARIFLQPFEDFLQAEKESQGDLVGIINISDMTDRYGDPSKIIRALTIPGRPPSLPGLSFNRDEITISAFHKADSKIVEYVHISKRLPKPKPTTI